MKKKKKQLLLFHLIGGISTICYFSCNKHTSRIQELTNKVATIEKEYHIYQTKAQQLEQKLRFLKNNESFAREALIRLDYAMGHTNETIYFLSPTS